jgi:glycosyltransferase involved in cell wall biosynthesis
MSTLGIDASNLRSGGGVTHLIELLESAKPQEAGFDRVIIWAGQQTLNQLPSRDWLSKISPAAVNKGFLRRTWWQRFCLSQSAREFNCDALLVPGGSFAGDFRPIVTMSQNLLPFVWCELMRYRFSAKIVKFLMLRFTQSRTFKSADGIIFLTEYARLAVSNVTGMLSGNTTVIPHGLASRFYREVDLERIKREYTAQEPCRLLYVSIVDLYKHQWHLIEAVHILRGQGLYLELVMIGPTFLPALDRLNKALLQFDPEGNWAHYRGSVDYDALHIEYANADIGIFASSCENLPIILLETMAAGLPIACSNRGPMPEVLGSGGVYFDPENPNDIAVSIEQLVGSPELREEKVKVSQKLCKEYSWSRCAKETFSFIAAAVRG